MSNDTAVQMNISNNLDIISDNYYIPYIVYPFLNEIKQLNDETDIKTIKPITYLHKYFPFIQKNKRSQIKYDDVGLYSISPPKTAEIITNYIKKYYTNNDIVITDAMAGIGGNTLSFAESFYYVNAIEYDSDRFQYMISNMSLFKKPNVLCINEDYLSIMNKLKQDIIFMDPPWGGKSYKDTEKIIIKINDISLTTICQNIIDNNLCSLLILKLPLNYDIDDLNKISIDITIERLSKIMIVICRIE